MLTQILATIICLMGISQHALAYFVAVPEGQGAIDPTRTTRIIISGRGGTLGNQAQLSALGTALLYKRNFREHQIVLMSVFEGPDNEASLLSAGWKIISRNDIKFDTNSVIREAKKFKKIRSFELFGHNSPSMGTQTDGPGFRFDVRNPVVKELTPLFDKSAFAIIHGCNSGWFVAQTLSKVWNIAVAGSFTGTRFERLHSDGHFYVDEENRFPNSHWATRNDDLGGISCEAGACLRMRPAYSPYNGEWGDLEGPLLSHYKFFCLLEVKDCEKRMASALFGFLVEKSLKPNSDLSDFREVAKQYLCPVYKDRTLTNKCMSQLDLIEHGRGNMQLSFVVSGKQLACTLQSCTGKITCIDDTHTCKIEGRVSEKSQTLAEEYLHLLSGFELLKQEGF